MSARFPRASGAEGTKVDLYWAGLSNPPSQTSSRVTERLDQGGQLYQVYGEDRQGTHSPSKRLTQAPRFSRLTNSEAKVSASPRSAN